MTEVVYELYFTKFSETGTLKVHLSLDKLSDT